ncbi:LSU ribosomal protein L22p (L17e) [hydrothermal vent metagenome]|uniref:LSU ribosomal protein L22p (L17e) n=1 Tax=hydrothermal vent metagenome TaxID=652676 RepID=A0A3B1CTV5_9ZZZZ
MPEEGLEMEAKAVLRYIRVTPRKARMVIDLIRGKNAEEAITILKFTPRHAARVVQKVLKSAVANATQKDMGDVDALRVSRVFVDPGPSMKRVLPRAMGRANTILKRTSHITVVIGTESEKIKPLKSAQRSAALEGKPKPDNKKSVEKKKPSVTKGEGE